MVEASLAWILDALVALAIAVLPVQVETISGDSLEAQFDGFGATTGSGAATGSGADTLRLDQAGRRIEVPFDEIISLQRTAPDDGDRPQWSVSLMGGSRIAAVSVSLADDELTIRPRQQPAIRVAARAVKAIRFRPPNAATDPNWLGILEGNRRRDTLVIRRRDDRLDPQDGIVEAISNERVTFNLDGDTIPAPINRLEGVVFGGSRTVDEGAAIRVVDIYGSEWAVTAIEPSNANEPIKLTLADSISHQFPAEQIESIRWSGGLLLLAGQSPASSSIQAYFKTNVDDALTQQLFRPHRDQDADLIMHGGSEIEFRVDPGYQTLSGAVQRHEEVQRAGTLTVSIEFDGTSVWREELNDTLLRGFEIPVDQARRLSFRVDSGGDGNLGDTIRLVRPRLLK